MSTPNPSQPAQASATPNGGGAEKPAKGEKNPFKDTLNLPQTGFAMKANLVQNEPASMKRWAALGVYAKLREQAAGATKPRFVFHDGPPYANGSLHHGHMMNKVLKDMVVRSKTLAGFDVPFVPGWDCHGLPIEHKVMLELVEKGKMAKLATLEEGQRRMVVRRECQAYAEKFQKLHTQQLLRMMTLADYANPYLTMTPAYEAAVLEVLAGLLERGLVYRALKPVHWSVANETALAEAELEYEDREDPSVYVDFEAIDGEAVYAAFGLTAEPPDDDDDDDAEKREAGTRSAKPAAGTKPRQTPCFMIWTTTPWTLPANLAIAVNPRFEYALVWVDGNVTVLATELVEKVMQSARAEEVVVLARAGGDKLVGLRYRHPFVDLSRGESVGAAEASRVFRIVPADYVTLEDGTGLVHTAPGHGEEDYQTGLREGLPTYCPVRGNGTYDDTAPAWLRGLDVWKANELVAKHLRDSGHLFYEHKFTHSYPHDWRSKTPTIFRCTEQWFVGVDKAATGTDRTLRHMALEAVGVEASRDRREPVRFVPEWGRNRMRGMLDSRPDWCISRQRAWGLPIPAFVTDDGTGGERTFMTAASVRAVASVVREKGSDAWFQMSPAELLAGYDAAKDAEAPAFARETGFAQRAKKGMDILDVWFESGSSWNAVMKQRGLARTDADRAPVDLYLEGSDQHRGWFQLSLLPALGVTGRSPFATLLTHGFMVDKDGRKLSKSKGDTIDTLFEKFGVDVLRWWVSSLAYENDVKVDDSYFETAGESYRKVRNTLRFLLSNLYDFTPSHEGQAGQPVPLSAFTPTSLEAWALGQFDALRATVMAAYEAYDFRAAHLAVYEFCNHTLSAVYLAATKDRLYCDRPDSPRRRRTQTAMWDLVDGLARLLAPIIPHTADEAWRALRGADKPGAKNADACVHLSSFPPATGVTPDADWPKVIAAREAALLAMEHARKAIGVENPLDMGVTLPDPDGALAKFDAHDLADLLGVSRVSLDRTAQEPKVADLRAEPRCERSWKRDGTVRARGERGMLSDRDAEALGV